MKPWLIEYLICPITGNDLRLTSEETDSSGEIIAGILATKNGQFKYKIIDGIPRFVKDHYAGGFGLQWKTHDLSQIDTESMRLSEERFWGETGFDPKSMKDQLVLDGGCGAGRFTDVASRAGAKVIAVDLSEAVEATHKNFAKKRDNVTVIQASLFNLPLKRAIFDYAFTLGVIHHTPRPLDALRSVAKMVKPNGEAGLSWYKKYWYTYLHQKYILRPIFKNWSEKSLYQFVNWYVPKVLPLSRLLSKIPFVELVIDRILPVANRDYIEGTSDSEKVDLAILDTFDWFNPKYDLPQTWKDVEEVMKEEGFICARSPRKRRGLHCIRSGIGQLA